MKRFLTAILILAALPGFAQVDRHDVRAGNRKFGREKYKEAEIDYRKAAVKDSLSVAAEYNLASTLYRQEDYENADKALQTIKDVAPSSAYASDYHYNAGDVALQKKDYQAAVNAFKEALLLTPDDLDAKENYIYAKKMLENQQNGGGGGNDDQNQDNQDQDQDQNQDQQNQDQDQDNKDQNQQQQQPEPQISQQQAQQMLQAIQAKEKETQDKVNKEKAAVMQSRQKEKNW